MSDAVFRIAADVSDYINKMQHAEKATKRVANSAGQIGEAVGKSMIKVDLLLRALNSVSRSVSQVIDKATDTARTSANRGAGLTGSLMDLRIRDPGAMNKKLSSGVGLATAEQSAVFAKSLAGATKDQPRPSADSEALLNAFQKYGAYGAGEGGQNIIAGIGKGLSTDDLISDTRNRFDAASLIARADPMSDIARSMQATADENKRIATEEVVYNQSGSAQNARYERLRGHNAENPSSSPSLATGAFGEAAGEGVLRFNDSAGALLGTAPGAESLSLNDKMINVLRTVDIFGSLGEAKTKAVDPAQSSRDDAQSLLRDLLIESRAQTRVIKSGSVTPNLATELR